MYDNVIPSKNFNKRAKIFLEVPALENGMFFHLRANNIFFQFSFCKRKMMKECTF